MLSFRVFLLRFFSIDSKNFPFFVHFDKEFTIKEKETSYQYNTHTKITSHAFQFFCQLFFHFDTKNGLYRNLFLFLKYFFLHF